MNFGKYANRALREAAAAELALEMRHAGVDSMLVASFEGVAPLDESMILVAERWSWAHRNDYGEAAQECLDQIRESLVELCESVAKGKMQ